MQSKARKSKGLRAFFVICWISSEGARIIWDHAQYLGLGINLTQSVKEKFDIGYSSKLPSEVFDFSME